MNTVAYSSFTENTKHYLESIGFSNQEIIILKDNMPAFKVLSLSTKDSVNLLKDSITFEDDVLSPIGDSWETEQ